MASEFNPFHAWLGIDSKIKSPHHFQLLDVSPKLKDPTEIQTAVDAGTKRCLLSLSKVPAGKHDELIAKIKQRIAIARKTLSTPQLRAVYVAKLKQKLKQQRTASSETATNTDSTPASHPHQASTALDPPQPAFQSESVKTPPLVASAKSIEGDIQPGIPMAITLPVSLPLGESPPKEVPVNGDGNPIDEVAIKKSRVRRKKSNLGLYLSISFLFALVGGTVLGYMNWEALIRLAGIKAETPSATGIHQDDNDDGLPKQTAFGGDEATSGTSRLQDQRSVSTQSAGGLKTINIEDLPELDEEEVMRRTLELEAEEAEREQREHLQTMEGDDSQETSPSDLDNENDSPGTAPNSEEDSKPSPEPVVRFDEFQLSKIRRHLQRTVRDLTRHDLRAASKSIDYANSVWAAVKSGRASAQLDASQQPVADLIVDSKLVHDLIEEFWNQVIQSCQEIPGGQEIEASGQIMSFIEADDQKIILRHAGMNITYDYEFCPPGLAVSLAKQGSIRDIPTWNRQLAAFYAVAQRHSGIDHSETIDQLLAESEAAGHDCSGIRRFANFKFGPLGKPTEKIEMPNRKTFSQIIQEFRSENSYQEPKKLSPGTAQMLSNLLLQIDSPNFVQHVSLLEEARLIGIVSGDAGVTEDAIIELNIYANLNTAKATSESFREISMGEMTPPQRRLLMECAIPFLKSPAAATLNDSDRELLARQLERLATDFSMQDAIRRLKQIKE